MKITTENLQSNYEKLVEKEKFDLDFVFLIILASIICTIGFKINSASVIIGAMVISPLLIPVVSIGAGLVKLDIKNVLRSLLSAIGGITIIVLISFIIAKYSHIEYLSEITSRLSATIFDYFLIAFFSGIAGTFAFFWPDISEAVVGIAISVALVPPVVMLGLGFANSDMVLALISSKIILINVVGIFLGSFVMFGFFTKNSKRSISKVIT